MKLEKKEDILLNFAQGEIKKLITKPKITAFGLNWQHCNHTIYFPTWSYEQYYQAIRRFWRFGQKNPVIVDMIYSDGQKRVIDALEAKTQKAIELFKELNRNIHESYKHEIKQLDSNINLPQFLGV
jgi:SNF2 family DNA or RNA helicase